MPTVEQNHAFQALPPPLRQTSPGTLEVKQGGGCIALFGLPFFLAGLAMLLGLLGILPVKGESGEPATPLLLGFMALIFLSVGGVMVFGRQWLVLDLVRRSALRQYGLLVPLRTAERPFSEFNAVLMSHNPGDSDSAESYPVQLRASMGKNLTIASPLKFGESRLLAEYLSRALDIPLSDITTDHETIVTPDRVDKPLHERLAPSGELPPPSRPSALRCEVDESAGATKIAIPSGGPRAVGWLGVFLPLIVLLFVIPVAVRFFTDAGMPAPVRFGFVAFLLLIFGLPSIFAGVRLMVASKRRITIVTASPAGLVTEQPSGRDLQKTVIPASELLDLDCSTFDSVLASARQSANRLGRPASAGPQMISTLKKLVPNKGIIVKSRTHLLTLGEGLSADELRYLVWLLRRALRAPR